MRQKKNTCVISWLMHCTLFGQWFTNDDENDDGDKKIRHNWITTTIFKKKNFYKTKQDRFCSHNSEFLHLKFIFRSCLYECNTYVFV